MDASSLSDAGDDTDSSFERFRAAEIHSFLRDLSMASDLRTDHIRVHKDHMSAVDVVKLITNYTSLEAHTVIRRIVNKTSFVKLHWRDIPGEALGNDITSWTPFVDMQGVCEIALRLPMKRRNEAWPRLENVLGEYYVEPDYDRLPLTNDEFDVDVAPPPSSKKRSFEETKQEDPDGDATGAMATTKHREEMLKLDEREYQLKEKTFLLELAKAGDPRAVQQILSKTT